MLTPHSGYIPNQLRLAAPAVSSLQIPATCLVPLLHGLHPRLNSLPGPVPLAPAPGRLLLALQAHLYVLAAAEFWGGQISPSWRPSKVLVAETLGANPKARRHHPRPLVPLTQPTGS